MLERVSPFLSDKVFLLIVGKILTLALHSPGSVQTTVFTSWNDCMSLIITKLSIIFDQ